ncbi:unnamed protein product [Amoebophrya sp. A25]|nr:unnamed protein product [Amoebophrya sp. A25]|eukprot:GSA25T00011918001.1
MVGQLPPPGGLLCGQADDHKGPQEATGMCIHFPRVVHGATSSNATFESPQLPAELFWFSLGMVAKENLSQSVTFGSDTVSVMKHLGRTSAATTTPAPAPRSFSGDPFLASAFFLAQEDVSGAVEAFLRAHFYPEAALLARLRLPSCHPLVRRVYQSWFDGVDATSTTGISSAPEQANYSSLTNTGKSSSTSVATRMEIRAMLCITLGRWNDLSRMLERSRLQLEEKLDTGAANNALMCEKIDRLKECAQLLDARAKKQ